MFNFCYSLLLLFFILYVKYNIYIYIYILINQKSGICRAKPVRQKKKKKKEKGHMAFSVWFEI